MYGWLTVDAGIGSAFVLLDLTVDPLVSGLAGTPVGLGELAAGALVLAGLILAARGAGLAPPPVEPLWTLTLVVRTFVL